MPLDLQCVSKSFGTKTATVAVLDSVSVHVGDGESVAFIGESGVGKSTLIKLIAGYETPDAGSIHSNGSVVSGPGPDRLVVGQQDSLLPWMTVWQNASFAGKVGYYQAERQLIDDRAKALLSRFGLWEHRDKFPRALSGGQRRRVELVRCLCVVPSIFLLDEPYSSLDEGLRAELAEHLLDWMSTSPTTSIVLVTHDLDEACFLADRVVILGGRPARVTGEVPICFSQARTASLRLTPEYLEAVAAVRQLYYASRSVMEGPS